MITGKSRTNVQASNLIETVAIRNLVKRKFTVQDQLQGIRPPPYLSASYRDHPDSSNQLWEPFEHHNFENTDVDQLFEGVTIRKIKRALIKFYHRLTSDSTLTALDNLEFIIAHRALVDTIEIPCERYRKKIREFRRGNHHVMFTSHYRNSEAGEPISRWFVGTVLFFFEHTRYGEKHFLAFVEVMKVHRTATHDKSIPVVYMNRPRSLQLVSTNERLVDSKYAVIKVDDITLQVGLVQSLDDDLKFSVIGNYHVFAQDMSIDSGSIIHL